MGYLRRTSNYLGRITLSNLTHMIRIANPVVIHVETPMINCEYYLEKEFIELIFINP